MRIIQIGILVSIFFAQHSLGASKQAIVEMHERSLRAIEADRTAPPYASFLWAMANDAAFDAIQASSHPELSYRVAFARTVELIKPQQAHLVSDWIASTFQSSSVSEKYEIQRAEQIARSKFETVRSAADHYARPLPFWPQSNPRGVWRPTGPQFLNPALPNWGSMQLFSGESVSRITRGLTEPLLDSAEYKAELNEVYRLGGKTSSVRTADQSEIAQFWVGGTGTVTPPGLWIAIALQRLLSTPVNFLDAVFVMKTLSHALCDAGIAAWDIKYRSQTWRPITAIQEDLGDKSWQPLVTTPPFPGYVSGHSTFSAAAAGVLAMILPLTGERLVVHSPDLPGVVRSYSSYKAAAEEAGMSRIYGGIHFQADNVDGLALGERVACRLIESVFGHTCSLQY